MLRDVARLLRVLFSEEFFAGVSHRLALTTPLALVDTARRSYRVSGLGLRQTQIQISQQEDARMTHNYYLVRSRVTRHGCVHVDISSVHLLEHFNGTSCVHRICCTHDLVDVCMNSHARAVLGSAISVGSVYVFLCPYGVRILSRCDSRHFARLFSEGAVA